MLSGPQAGKDKEASTTVLMVDEIMGRVPGEIKPLQPAERTQTY